MPVHNSDVAQTFKRVADLLAIEEANQFRVRAYRDAARTIETLSRPVADMVEEGADLSELEDIGEDLAGKIEEIVKTGSLAQLEEIENRTPPTLAEMLRIEGLGPRRVQTIYEGLQITTLDELQEAVQEGRVRELEGFGQKTERQILDELQRQGQEEERTLLNVAEEVVQPLTSYLKDMQGVQQVAAAGSYRRRKETVGDLDILATGEDGRRIIRRFVQFEDVEDALSEGETRSTVLLRTGIQVDLRVVAAESYGAALLYFTGSKAHNISLRDMALERDLKVNEYGVFEGEERIAGETEEEIYDLFDLAYIQPELREDWGEIEAAREGHLPDLVTLDQIRGDLQTHTKASDGHNTLQEMARAAQERGYEYLAITDHSPHVGVTQGLDAEALARRIDEIEGLNQTFDGFRLLKGIEVDILEDGSLDLPDDILSRCDVVVCSVHTHFDLPAEKQTERIIRTLDNPHVHILAHPTGRRIGKRAPYEVQMERLMEAALERGCYLEVNAAPERLDLKDVYCKKAREMGLKLVVSTDAHRVSELDQMRYGLGQARRGWLEAGDVLNTRPWEELSQLLQRG